MTVSRCRALALFISLLAPIPVSASGETVYRGGCNVCHDTGVAGAPALGDVGAWAPRINQGMAVLELNAVNGLNAMPPKGGRTDLSDAQVKAAVGYMVEALKRVVTEPPAAPESDPAPEPESETAQASPPTSPTEALINALKGEGDYHQPPPESAIPQDKYGDDVRRGLAIFTETYRYARRYTGNELACSNCHMEKGRRAHAAPLWGAFGIYPTYRKKGDRNTTLEERIQQCFRFSMNGLAPPLDAPELRALVSYAHFLSKGVPVGVEMPGRGFPQVVDTGQDPSPVRGGEVYRAKCAACHGEGGKGVRNPQGGGYQFPPLWGWDSYNKGAGLARDKLLAGFVKANMPLGAEFSLSDQEALDVATYINLQIRPWDPRKGILDGLLE